MPVVTADDSVAVGVIAEVAVARRYDGAGPHQQNNIALRAPNILPFLPGFTDGAAYLLALRDRGLAIAAISPRCAAAAASTARAACPAATAAAATTPATAAATPATTAPATTAPGDFLALWRCIFLVEHIERRQADVEDFFFTERDDLTRSGILRLDIRNRPGG
jgi:hypothetical protein